MSQLTVAAAAAAAAAYLVIRNARERKLKGSTDGGTVEERNIYGQYYS